MRFGIIYGQTEFGLSKELGISRKEAKDYIESYFARYSGVKQWIDTTIQEARSSGISTTMMGRRRYIKGQNAQLNLRVVGGHQHIICLRRLEGFANTFSFLGLDGNILQVGLCAAQPSGGSDRLAAGEQFNLNSSKQLGVVLFEKMGLPVVKRTKTKVT